MNALPPQAPRPLLPLVLLHLAAAGACFGFFSVVPIVGCLVVIAIDNDPGGPLFLPVFIVAVLLFAAVITGILSVAALLSDLLRRHYRISVWMPPLVVLMLATVACWLLFSTTSPVVPPLVGGVVALAFIVHWGAISTAWFLPRLLFCWFRAK